VSMIGVIVLITDVIYSNTAAIVAGVVALLVFGGLWLLLPGRLEILIEIC